VSDIKVFRLTGAGVEVIPGNPIVIERSLQALVERHLEVFLGVRFLASEYSTTKSHGGRIDTLGIDESGSPVIVEYKRALNENVVNQGLFYLSWLLDHKADFTLLAMDKLGSAAANAIDWRDPRLICVAGDFTKFDIHAIEQIPRNIELVRYHRYGADLILLERVAKTTTKPGSRPQAPLGEPVGPVQPLAKGEPKSASAHDRLQRCSNELQGWFSDLRAYILGLGDDVDERITTDYIAFRRKGGFAWVRFHRSRNQMSIGMPLPPSSVRLEEGFAEIGSGGNLVVHVDSAEDVERAKPIIAESYSIS
jgi:predicted transport protein